MMLNINKFICDNITHRSKSLFKSDIEDNHDKICDQIDGKSLLVIGGAGSIGSSFIKALLPYRPGSLTVVDANENGLTELTRNLRSTDGLYMPEEYKTYALNYSDPIVEKIFRFHGGFDVVANFAAHKHVRSEKDIFSVEAMINNNVIRAKQLLDMIKTEKPSKFFCVSTDKAANPVNIMGASKKIMELMIMAYSRCFNVTTARFANVAFSAGSLPDGFLHRIANRQPLIAPSDVKRYFVSPEESGQICMLACVLGKSSEIFFPKLGHDEMMSFSEICDRLLCDLGFKPKYCNSPQEALEECGKMHDSSKYWPVCYQSSDTTGEKMEEEFVEHGEIIDDCRFKSLGVIINALVPSLKSIEEICDSFTTLFKSGNASKDQVVSLIKKYVPNFAHFETGVNLDQKM